MISMVVSNEQATYGIQLNTIVLAMFLERTDTYANIYHQSVCSGGEIIAITAATATKG